MEKVFSPLTKKSHVSFIKNISASGIIELYKNYHIDVSKYFKDIKDVSVYRCNDTGYTFYYPLNLSGDGKFYEHFQQYDWYYMPWKWEHEITVQYVKENSTLLEVGCAHGAFIKKVNELVPLRNSVGLELNESAVSKDKNWEIKNQTIETFSENNLEEFDTVCSFQVLEHISDVHSFLESQVKCLKKGGTLIISVPNNKSFINAIEACLNMPPHHMGLWDDDSLKALTTLFPLKLVNIHYEELKEYHVAGYLESVYYAKYPLLVKKLVRKFHKSIGLYQKRYRDITNKRISLLGHTILVSYEKI